MDALEQRIISVISRFSEKDESDIVCNSTFEELALTSLDTVMIAFDLEEELEIKLPDSNEVYDITTVQELIDSIRPHVETASIEE